MSNHDSESLAAPTGARLAATRADLGAYRACLEQLELLGSVEFDRIVWQDLAPLAVPVRVSAQVVTPG